MDNRPTVFIGSSTEGLKVANALEAAFGDRAQVTVWNADDFFQPGQAFFKSLLEQSSVFEFSILVFTDDDRTTIRDETHKTARDNVLFEFGLFLGRSGERHAYAFVQNTVRLPTDLLGIHFDKFKLDADGNPDAAFPQQADRIARRIVNYHENTTEFSHLPSTALAIGYFHNFLSDVCSELNKYEPITIGEKSFQYSSYTLTIIIADDLRLVEQTNVRDIVQGLSPITVKNSRRAFPFYIQTIPPDGAKHLDLYDIPTTMKSSREAISKLFGGPIIGQRPLQVLAEKREISNFERTIRLLLHEVPVWSQHVRYRYLTEFVRP